MAEQRQSWAEQTVDVPPQQHDDDAFRRGVARVTPRARRAAETMPHQPSGTGWPGDGRPRPRPPVRYQLRQLRRGSGWTKFGAVFAAGCWAVWAFSAPGDLTTPVVAFILTLFVTVGLFALSRLLGRIVWERQLGRVRRSARGAHLVTGLFLIGTGVAYLRQTEWVVGVWTWVTSALA